ncbi:MAG: SGNH/GDSL hydrolase family protein [Rhodospirillales bacterium]|nr:SGNH/GDSL hydrolase family protein [Rhodospirillales bacterium]
MKNILCYGDSNTWGARPLTVFGEIHRYPLQLRWTTVLQQQLGPAYHVVAEGLNNRTTAFDDEIEGRHKNGQRHFFACIESHMPLDLVIIMLGTNDLKSRFGKSSWDIACGAGSLLDILANPAKPLVGGQPERLLISPPPLGKLELLAANFEGGPEKSMAFAENYEKISSLRGCHFLDAGAHITTSDVDGVHFDEDQLTPLGLAVADTVRQIIG